MKTAAASGSLLRLTLAMREGSAQVRGKKWQAHSICKKKSPNPMPLRRLGCFRHSPASKPVGFRR